jgi:hypothetical protein
VPNNNTLESIIDAIIANCSLSFPVDQIAILNFEHAIKTRSSGNLYLSYAFLSPRSSNPNTHPIPTTITTRRQLELLQANLHANLDGPKHFHDLPILPPIAEHFKVSIPFINDMDESLQFLIEGISVSALLGERQVETIYTLRHLGYLIFNEVKALYSTFPSHDPFPPELNKLRTRFSIGTVISTKKVRFTTTQQQQKQQRRTTNQHPPERPPHPVLGVVLTKQSPYAELLYDAIHFVCIKNKGRLNLFGNPTDHISLALHEWPQDYEDLLQLARSMGTSHSSLHDPTKFKIIRNVPIHPHILEKQHYLLRAIKSFGSC